MPAVARLALLLGISLFAPHALASSPISETGELQGAPWRIDVPNNWNGELVMLAHGFEPVGTPRSSAWPANEATPALLGAGYAVAQSGYRTQGWAVADAVADTERLRQDFITGIRTPGAPGFSASRWVVRSRSPAWNGSLIITLAGLRCVGVTYRLTCWPATC